jgi:hypothetical protein
VDAGPGGPASAELVVAGTAHNSLAGSEPDDEVHPTAHPRQAGPRGTAYLRFTTKSRGGIEPHQPGRERALRGLAPAFPSTTVVVVPAQITAANAPTKARVLRGKATASIQGSKLESHRPAATPNPNQPARRQRPPPTALTATRHPQPQQAAHCTDAAPRRTPPTPPSRIGNTACTPTSQRVAAPGG